MNLQKIFTAGALALLLALLAGCAFLEDLQLFREEETESAPEETVLEQELDLTEPDVQSREQSGENADAASADSRRVVLYFAAQDGTLAPEERDIPRQEGIARATLNELIAGPQSAALNPTLPASALVEGMTVSDGLCTVDFSSELAEHMSADPDRQLLAVYSIVNTLAQFDSVERVRILVDGETPAGGLGGLDLTAALAPALL